MKEGHNGNINDKNCNRFNYIDTIKGTWSSS